MFRYYLLLAVLLVSCRATAGECPADAVPIQIIAGEKSDDKDIIVTFNDGTKENVSALIREDAANVLSAFTHSDPSFSYFVETVTQHVAGRLGKDNLCTDNPDSTRRSSLRFVNWPITIGEVNPLALISIPDRKHSASCRIVSPWIDFSFGRSPVPWVQGVVRWNQRQLLADQAILDGASNVPQGVAIPLTQREFFHFAFEYADSEIDHVPATAKLKPIAARVPADLMWLFRRAVQTTRWPFDSEAMVTMRKATEKSTEKYTALTIALIDRCFASDGEELHYSSILDVADLISLKQYKIDTPLR